MAGLLGGPSVLGVAGLLAYARKILGGSTRDPGAGWRMFGSGVALVVWLTLFLILSTGGVLNSWQADGDVEPPYVALTTAWLVAIGVLVAIVWNARSAARYLSESYRADDQPVLVRLLCLLFRL